MKKIFPVLVLFLSAVAGCSDDDVAVVVSSSGSVASSAVSSSGSVASSAVSSSGSVASSAVSSSGSVASSAVSSSGSVASSAVSSSGSVASSAVSSSGFVSSAVLPAAWITAFTGEASTVPQNACDGGKGWVNLYIHSVDGLTALGNWSVKAGNYKYINTLISSGDISAWPLQNGETIRIHQNGYGSTDSLKSDNNPDYWDVTSSAIYFADDVYGSVWLEDGIGNVINIVAYDTDNNSSGFWLLSDQDNPLAKLQNAVSAGVWSSSNRSDAFLLSPYATAQAELINPAAPGSSAADWKTVPVDATSSAASSSSSAVSSVSSQSSSSGGAVTVTVGTYNVENFDLGGAASGQYANIAAFALSSQLDVLTLNEVQDNDGDEADFASALTSKGWSMAYHSFYDMNTAGDSYNSIGYFSRYPVDNAEAILGSYGPRSIYRFRVNVSGNYIWFYACHLKSGASSSAFATREAQASALADYIRANHDPATESIVILGDMNTMGADSDSDWEDFHSGSTLDRLSLKDDADSSNDFTAVNYQYMYLPDTTNDNYWETNPGWDSLLDHIILSPGAMSHYVSSSVAVPHPSGSGTYGPSDHYPVTLQLSY